ncbi:conserved hypothetical protein [Leptospira biflexa serovar Patoc strain 'Patoc 1 (Ames)']|uniref:CD-NTase-associated protein 12/Pycsar effector protein TIR domain-containing protein n=1 Tax=Leptospira biflexa serovar Patoc (strain Patoc 1 / ATCC 23582 / Paris) TaxID=456481 RepID=B0ST31_LEPBP|nr:hypothetical protein [Leptospira biflexa]ABZ94608.1 conserved hypothetical protein [Leptospira biflexa serovar Patoc strain 'Patoc 1 (Ames)']ABZ98271.1 Hypothetical protein LEPBI_I2172 [Leptospira biflexa serovar Patoc strain 'Patoc 1 (Paris)']
MEKCFIIQPFDGGKFDKRYEDIFKPAILNAGLEPYRVDQDINSIIPIDEINDNIRDASVCLADITIDNPNVWFELGLAIAYGKDTILVCSEERSTKFPFDIQHRNIIKYKNESASDFEKLKESIENKVKAFSSRKNNMAQLSKNVIKETEGLDSNEIVVLVSVAESFDLADDGLSTYQIKNEAEKAGYTKIATTLALKKLTSIEYLSPKNKIEEYSNEPYTVYSITDNGMQWLLDNKSKLVLKTNEYQ